MATPVKNYRSHRPLTSENVDPNVLVSAPPPAEKLARTPESKSAASSKKSGRKNPARVLAAAVPPPPPPERQRKFVVARKGAKRAADEVDSAKRRQEAYDALRASQDEFFRKDVSSGAAQGGDSRIIKESGSKDGTAKEGKDGTAEISVCDAQDLEGSAKVRKMRSFVMEEALSSIPEPGSGRVKHLVKAFESLLSISKESEAGMNEDMNLKAWPLPGLQPSVAIGEDAGTSSASVFSSAEFFPVRDFDRDPRLHSSLDGNVDRLSWQSGISTGGRRSRRTSSESSRSSWNKMLKVTSQKPFKLRTEQRGRLKEEKFIKKVKEMLIEEEKKRIPIAQGLPWTTDEPESLVKPPVKESTEPVDLVLHSEVRAVERAEFDHYVAERMSFAEQLRLERERQRKLEEEEEIQQLRRELVPKAQPMPYFDRPFVPKKSDRPQTIPKEPRFHIHPVKSSRSRVLMKRR